MARHLTRTLAAAAFGSILLHGIATVNAQSYPRIVGSGENASVDYGPGPQQNIVGGGSVVVSGSGENTEVRHLDPHYAQGARTGVRSVTIGSGESAQTVWVPVDLDRTARALIGRDGSIPEFATPRTAMAQAKPGQVVR